jgi:hypothetical protein
VKLTLLEYVQNILSALNSDEVNSISDNAESLQVAEILKTTYFNIIARTHLPEHKQLIQLEPSLDPTQPVLMYVPDGIGRIHWVQYFNNNITNAGTANSDFQHDLNVDIPSQSSTTTIPPPGYQYVTVLPVKPFLDIVTNLNPENSNVASYQFVDSSNAFPGTYTLYYQNDRQPTYCTILSDFYVLFDSFDSTVDDTLQASKTMAYGEVIPFWSMTDTFIPNIDEQTVPLLLNEAKSLAFYELKQTTHPKAEQEAKRQWSSVQKDKSKSDKPTYFDQLPDFGRNARSSYAGLSYFKMRGWDRP